MSIICINITTETTCTELMNDESHRSQDSGVRSHQGLGQLVLSQSSAVIIILL
jgi:hypothetical protein